MKREKYVRFRMKIFHQMQIFFFFSNLVDKKGIYSFLLLYTIIYHLHSIIGTNHVISNEFYYNRWNTWKFTDYHWWNIYCVHAAKWSKLPTEMIDCSRLRIFLNVREKTKRTRTSKLIQIFLLKFHSINNLLNFFCHPLSDIWVIMIYTTQL